MASVVIKHWVKRWLSPWCDTLRGVGMALHSCGTVGGVCMALCVWALAGLQMAEGQNGSNFQLRIVDGAGLVRVARVVAGAVDVAVVVEGSGVSAGGACSATNVDGLAAEQRVAISPQGRCLFRKLAPGSWQVRLEFAAEAAGASARAGEGARWRVEIE